MPTAEVYAWPEAKLYVYPAGGPSAIMAYAENVACAVTYGFLKFKNQTTGAFAARTNFVQADKDVTMSFGQMYYSNDTFLQANSATAFNMDVVFSAAGGIRQTAQLSIWSAVFTNWSMQGAANGLFHSTVALRAADISGV